MITGRSASRSSATARSTPSAAGPSPGIGSESGPPPGSAPSANTWSSGKSTKGGPVGAVIASASATSTRPGIMAVLWAVRADLVTGATNGTWSISCSDPCPQRRVGARPPSTSMGELFFSADAIALMPLDTPGPAVSAHTPGSRVTFAQPSAAKTASDLPLPAGATPAGRSAATVGGTPAGFADVEHLRSPCQTPGVHVSPQRGQTPLRVVEGLGRDAPS